MLVLEDNHTELQFCTKLNNNSNNNSSQCKVGIIPLCQGSNRDHSMRDNDCTSML